MPIERDQHIPGVQLKIGGQPVEIGKVLEVRVEDNLMLPDACTIRIAGWDWNDSSQYDFGKEIELKFGAVGQSSVETLFTGQVASLEPEFGREGVSLTIRGYDHSHKMNRTKVTKTYQDQTFSDIAGKVAGAAGLGTGTIDSDPGGSHKFVQQNNETDWEFLWRLANRIDFEVVVSDKKLNFRRAGSAKRYEKTLKYGEDLFSFKPSITGVQQVKDVTVRGWDPQAARALEATELVPQTDSEIGIPRSAASDGLGGGNVTVADAPVHTQQEASALAKSIASRLGQGFLEAEGSCRGDPKLLAGSIVKIGGVGPKFEGKYMVGSTTHVFKGERGYDTHFRISGRTPRSLVDLLKPAKTKGWGNSVVVGVVTQNDDPDKLGRVRVKYPALGDQTEGWWARVASASAGQERGLLMMPIVGDEVLIAFEHDDVTRPYVIGSLWNGNGKPGPLVKTDGSFELMSDKFVDVTSKDSITIKTDKDYTLETKQKVTETADQDVHYESKTAKMELKAGTTLTIEGTQKVEIKCGPTLKFTLDPAGMKAEMTNGAATISLTGPQVRISGAQIQLG